MAVFRVERNKGYTVMSNHHLRNKELCPVRAFHKGLYRPILFPFWRGALFPHGAQNRRGFIP